jgi:hypothetical protein
LCERLQIALDWNEIKGASGRLETVLFDFEKCRRIEVIRRRFSWAKSDITEGKTFNSSLTTSIKILAVNLRYTTKFFTNKAVNFLISS